MNRFQLNSLLVVQNNSDARKPTMYFDAAPVSAKHHTQLIEESFRKNLYFEPDTMVICLEVKDDVYGINLRILEPNSGKVGWVISGSVRSL